MDKGEKTYSIVITDTAKLAYFELLNYFYEHYSLNRAAELAQAVLDAPLVLIDQPLLGKLEPALEGRKHSYRYLLFRRSNKATIKIIYFTDQSKRIIYVTDFFPTERHPDKLTKNS